MPYIISLVLLIVVSGGWYVNHLRLLNKTLSKDLQTQEIALGMVQSTLDKRTKDYELKRKQVAAKQQEIAKLYKTAATLNSKLQQVSKNDKQVNDCLAVRTSNSLIEQLRNSTRAGDSSKDN